MSIETESFTLIEGFTATPDLLFKAFTDAKLIQGYTRVPAEIEAKEGSKFTLFAGSIEGEFTAVDEPKSFTQKWRFKEWPADHFSDVTFTFETHSESVVKLTIQHDNIPTVDAFGNRDVPDKVKSGWENHFFRGIHQVLGYHKSRV